MRHLRIANGGHRGIGKEEALWNFGAREARAALPANLNHGRFVAALHQAVRKQRDALGRRRISVRARRVSRRAFCGAHGRVRGEEDERCVSNVVSVDDFAAIDILLTDEKPSLLDRYPVLRPNEKGKQGNDSRDDGGEKPCRHADAPLH